MSYRNIAAWLKIYARDLEESVRQGADARSRFRLIRDFTISRVLGLLPGAMRNRLREVRLQGDIYIRYRLNKGDLHSIRELWFAEDYRLPFAKSGGVLLDLGANIGMASVWLTKRYGFTKVIAIEPDPANVALVRQNFEQNGIPGEVVEAAVGPTDGTARFQFCQFSNCGKLSEDGSLVKTISVDTILTKFAVDRLALIKIDIEGGEQALFDEHVEWLTQTDAMILEFHPELVDCERITRLVTERGFRFIPAHTLAPDNMPCFVRDEGSAHRGGDSEPSEKKVINPQVP